MILRFQSKIDKNGNKLQLEFDTDKKTIAKGYWIFCDSDAIIIKKKEIHKLYENILDEIFKK